MNDPKTPAHTESAVNPPLEAVVQMRRTLSGVMLTGLVILAGWWGVQFVGVQPGSASEAPSRVQTGVNPNDATWYELAQLPGLGESAGRAIVAFREERRQTTSQPVFKSAADLEPVPGIGPRTIERIAAHLRFDCID
jgi:competence ComEA-like helix-hairpin-helix protein